jgi:uncharacterized FlaG/YvyC family protein
MDVTSLNPVRPAVATPVTAAIPAEQQAQNRQLIRAVRAVNDVELYGQDSEVTFVLNQEGRPLLQVVNRKTKEVIRQIPPQDVLSAAKSLGFSE